MKLNDSIAIVTGAASGIGLATAQGLAQAGATVVLGDIADDKGEQAAAAIRAAGQRARTSDATFLSANARARPSFPRSGRTSWKRSASAEARIRDPRPG